MSSTYQRLLSQRPRVFRELLEHPDTYASLLLAILVDEYDFEVLQWQPETIALEVYEDFQARPPQATIDRIMAAISIITTDQFWNDLPSFIQICNILSGDEFHPDTFNPADAEEIYWGITEAMLLDPPEVASLEEAFSDEIRYYIGEVLNHSGFVDPPGVLKIALYDAPRKDPVGDFSGDSMMYETIYATIADKNRDLQQNLEAQKKELLSLLSRLPLKRRVTEATSSH